MTTRAWGALVAMFATVVAMLSVGGVAEAYFTDNGSGTGSVTTSTLHSPTAVSGSQVTGTSTVAVTWNAPVGPTAATGYYVERTPSPSGATVAACGTSAAAPTATTSCSDVSVPVGDYTYVVVALHQTWTSTSPPSSVVQVVETTQSITFTSSPSAPEVGGTYVVTATGGGSGNPVTFTSATPGVCTISGGSLVTFAHVGTCTINADQAGSAEYDPAPQVQQSFPVDPGPQTITFTSPAPSNAVVGGSGYTPAATGGASGNPITFSIDPTTAANCSISFGVVTHQHVGSCTVNAQQAASADYLAGSAQQSYAIGQGSQAINFLSVNPTATVTDTYTPGVTGGASGNPVVIGTTTPSVCTAADGIHVTYVATGTCVITANQAGNADYLAAAQAQQQTIVSKKSQTISFTSTAPSSATYQGATYTVTATSTSGLTVSLSIDGSSASVCSLSGSTVSFIGVGACTINASQAGNGTYDAAPQVQQAFTVAKASQTISFGALGGKTFGNGPFAVSATASSGLAVAFTSATPSVCTTGGTNGSTVTIVGAGTCTINANQAGNGLYDAASQVQQSFTVAKATQSITFPNPGARTFGDAPFALTATATSGLTVALTSATPAVCTVSGLTVTIVAAGSCSLNADQAGNTNYFAATQVPQTFTVAKANQTITLNAPASKTFGEAPFTVTATATSGLPVTVTSATPGVCTVSGTTVTILTAGTCTLHANQAGNANVNPAAQVQSSITVAQASQTITFNQPATPANASTSTSLSATSTSGLTVSFTTPSAPSICTIVGTTVNYVGAGSCVINANQAGNGNYSAAPQVQRTVTVVSADTTPPAITNIMSNRPGLTWTNNNNGSSSWNGGACAGNQLCATILDSGAGASGVDPSTITFSLVGNAGAGVNAGKCYDSAVPAGFKTGPCTITVAYNAGTGLATATVLQANMVDGTYTFVIHAKDNAGNAAVQQTVTLTIA